HETVPRGGVPAAGAVATAVLSALYCAGLFSNSFIEAEDGLHRFLGASALVSLSVSLLLATSPPPPSGARASPAARRPANAVAYFTAPEPAAAEMAVAVAAAKAAVTMSPSSDCRSRRGAPHAAEGDAYGAALCAALAAACVRTATAVQASATEGTSSTEVTFSFTRSVLPLPALWLVFALARGGGGGGGGSGGTGDGGSGVPVGGEFRARVYPAGPGLTGRGHEALELFRRHLHGVLQALSLAAVWAYWAIEAAAAVATAAAAEGEAGATVAEAFAFLPPARLLLPRVTYVSCLVGLAAAVLLRPSVHPPVHPPVHPVKARTSWTPATGAAAEAGKRETPSGHSSEASRPSETYAQTLSATAAAVVSHLVPVVVILLGPGSPAVVLLVSAACGFFLRGVSLAAGMGVAVPLGAVTVAWSIVGRAFFFLTGHHNQFSRLQYSAAFVGE
ncbi:unnamed protein product, partial [Laminaria digitata]